MREIEVDKSIYRVSTILSTIISIGLIVSGLILIDLGISGSGNTETIVGLLLILIASVFYVFSSKFTPNLKGEQNGR